MVSVKIDSVSVNIESGLEFIKDGGEEFNLGVMKLVNSTQREPYPDYADIEITVNSKVYEACIQKDLSKRTSTGIYNHDIVLAEPVIKLSQYIHPDRKYTTWDGLQITWLDQLENLLETLELNTTSPFTIHADTQTLLGATAVEKEYSGGDLLTTLTDMFRGVNAVPTLTLANVIGHELFAEFGNEISIGDIIAETLTSDIADYGMGVHSKIKSGTYEGDLTTGATYFPAKGYGITARSKDDKYDDDDAQYFLDSGIRRVLTSTILNLDSVSLGILEIDISDWIVSKDEWDDLETETLGATLYAGTYKNNTLYFVEGDNIIQNVGVITANSIFGGQSALVSIIKSYWTIETGDTNEYKAQDLNDLKLEWYFVPERDLDVRVERHNIDRVVKNATVMNNQKDSTLELQRYGEALKSHINRIGNDTFEVSIRYSDLVPFTTWDLNDYTSDGYKIVKIKFLTRDNSLDVTYKFTKNQSILNPQTSVNRSVSPFTISKRNILSNFIYNDYIEFAGTDRTATSLLTANGLKAFMNALKWDATKDLPIYNCQYFSLDASTGTDFINMSAMSFPLGNTLVFNAQFNAPRIAGYQLTTDGVIGHKLVPVTYADANGQVDNFFVQWGNGGVVVPDDHPIGAEDTSFLFSTNLETIGLNPDEIFGITHHQHVITDRSNLIIGDYLMTNNSLITELLAEPDVMLRVYDDNPNHTIYDKVAKDVASSSAGSYAINTACDEITITGATAGKSWAIMKGTSPYNLYLAYNNVTGLSYLNTIYINRLEARPDIETL